MYWSQTESSKWSLDSLSHDLGHPFTNSAGILIFCGVTGDAKAGEAADGERLDAGGAVASGAVVSGAVVSGAVAAYVCFWKEFTEAVSKLYFFYIYWEFSAVLAPQTTTAASGPPVVPWPHNHPRDTSAGSRGAVEPPGR